MLPIPATGALVHPPHLAVGILLGALVVLGGARRPAWRGPALGIALGVALAWLAATAHGRWLALGLAGLTGAAGAGLGWLLARGRGEAGVDLVWLAAAAAVSSAFVFLTVPDTEGATVLLGLFGVVLLGWAVWPGRTAAPRAGLAAGTSAGAILAVALDGANGRWTPFGWWLPKLVLVALLVAASVIASVRSRGRATSEPGRPER